MNDSVSLDDLLAHRAWMLRLAHALVRDPHTAEDLAQEAWVAAMRSPPSDPAAVRGWFRRVLTRLAMNRRRGEGRREARERASAASSNSTKPDDAVAAMEAHQRVVQAVLALPSPARETVVLRYFEDLSPSEIATRTGIPASTVRSRLQRALEVLRERLDEGDTDGRRPWRAALFITPLPSVAEHVRPIGRRLAAAGVLGAMLMNTKILATVVVVALVAVLWPLVDFEETVPERTTAVETAATNGADPRRSRTRERVARKDAEDEASRAPSAAHVVEEPSAGNGADQDLPGYPVEITVIGADGTPAGAARVTFSDPHDGMDEEIEEVEEGVADVEPRRSPSDDEVATSVHSTLTTTTEGRLRIRHDRPSLRIWAEWKGATGVSERLELKSGETRRVTIQLVAAHAVSGTISAANGTPLQSARVDVTVPGVYGPISVARARTDELGAYRIHSVGRESLAKGATLVVEAPGHVTARIPLPRTDLTELSEDVVLAIETTVSGRVVGADGEPLKGVRVGVLRHGRNGLTDESGRFRLTGLPAGPQELLVRSHLHAEQVVDAGEDEGGTREVGDIVLRGGGTITGRVVDAAGEPVTRGTAYLTLLDDQDAILRSVVLDDEGGFELSAVGPAAYRVVLAVPGTDGSWTAARYVLRHGVRAGEELEVVAGEALSALVRVVDPVTGRAPETPDGLLVVVEPRDGSGETSRQLFPQLHQGLVRVGFPRAGTYRVSVRLGGFEAQVTEEVVALSDREVRLRVELRRAPE